MKIIILITQETTTSITPLKFIIYLKVIILKPTRNIKLDEIIAERNIEENGMYSTIFTCIHGEATISDGHRNIRLKYL